MKKKTVEIVVSTVVSMQCTRNELTILRDEEETPTGTVSTYDTATVV